MRFRVPNKCKAGSILASDVAVVVYLNVHGQADSNAKHASSLPCSAPFLHMQVSRLQQKEHEGNDQTPHSTDLAGLDVVNWV